MNIAVFVIKIRKVLRLIQTRVIFKFSKSYSVNFTIMAKLTKYNLEMNIPGIKLFSLIKAKK